MTTKTVKRKPTVEKKYYECVCCGKTKIEDEFYKSKGSPLWTLTEGRVLYCKDCINQNFQLMRDRYGEETAVMIVCHWLDVPFVSKVYNSVIINNAMFDIGDYTRILNGPQYSRKSFATSITDGELYKQESLEDAAEAAEAKWSREDLRNKKECVEMIGYDPFLGYPDGDRKYLFGELSKYLDEDVLDDAFKLSQIIQVVTNNNQIRQYDLMIAKMNPKKDADAIKTLNTIKKDLVSATDKIAKENEISVKNRSNKDVGKSTLTYLMRDLREKDFDEAEANYYDQLRSVGTLWAIDMSTKAILQNTLFDENDKQEIFVEQRKMIQDLQSQSDDLREENRLLKIENAELKGGKK